jgi:hypothetical protein
MRSNCRPKNTEPVSAHQRGVNPGLKPLKGYWTVIHDCGIVGEVWNRVSWNATLTNGCSVEVYVRASDDRQALANDVFVPATNDVTLTGPTANGVRGQFIEVRLAMTRDNATNQPVLDDLTLHGMSTSFAEDSYMGIVWEPYETDDAWFISDVPGPEPVTYQWFIQYPWTNQFALLPEATNADLILTNVDLWDDGTWVSLCVSNAFGEILWFGPVQMHVWASPINIPTFGKADRYPATVNVRGQAANFNYVTVTLTNLTHYHPNDLDILLVSPSGTKIMLISDAGGSTPVTNATLVFHPASQNNPLPPDQSPIPSGTTTDYSPVNYDGYNDSMPSPAPAGPYTRDLDDLPDTDPDPNGVWKLYISDDSFNNLGGILYSSWRLQFHY